MGKFMFLIGRIIGWIFLIFVLTVMYSVLMDSFNHPSVGLGFWLFIALLLFGLGYFARHSFANSFINSNALVLINSELHPRIKSSE